MSMLVTNYDNRKIFVWNNRFDKGSYTATADVTLLRGTVMGRVTTTGKLVPLTVAATDGSNEPVGVLGDDYVVKNGSTITVTYCFAGDVAKNLVVVADGASTLESAVGTKGLLKDLITRNTGIKLVDSTDLTKLDNQ